MSQLLNCLVDIMMSSPDLPSVKKNLYLKLLRMLLEKKIPTTVIPHWRVPLEKKATSYKVMSLLRKAHI